MKTKYTTESYIELCKKIHGDKYEYDKIVFTKLKSRITVICKKHGEFTIFADNFLKRKQGCPQCFGKKMENKFVIDELNIIHKNKYDYSKFFYKKAKDKCIIICPEHGDFTISYDKHKTGRGCPKCSKINYRNKRSHNTEWFINKSKEIHNDKYDYSKSIYTTYVSKIIITCPIHGDFEQTAKSHINGHGCQKCKIKNQTILFEKLKEYFNNDEILFEHSPEWLIFKRKQSFDIFFPKYNIAIEYNGEQHYYPIKHFGGLKKFELQNERDKNKYELSLKNNCKILYIKYNYKENELKDLINQIETLKYENL